MSTPFEQRTGLCMRKGQGADNLSVMNIDINMLRLFCFLMCFVLIACHSVIALAQSSEKEDLAFSYYKFREAKQFIAEKGDCSISTNNFIRVKGLHHSVIRDLDEKLNKGIEESHLLETKVIALYGLADCYNQRKSYETAIEFADEAVNIISKLLSKNPSNEKNKREYVYANERLGLYAQDVLAHEVARSAFFEAVLHGEEISKLNPTNYDDNRNLLINYVRLSKVTEEPLKKVKLLKEAACVSSHILSMMPPEDRDTLFGGVLFELNDARQLAGKPTQEIETHCKINPNSTIKELP